MNLLKALARTSSMTLFSRVLGMLRDIMNAYQFGAGFAFDAFNVAFRLPNMFRRIFAEGAFSQAFVPILAEYKTEKGEAETRAFVADVAGVLSLILLAFTVICVVGAPVLVYLTAKGFRDHSDKFDLAVALTRITFPYIFLISLSSLAGGILNTWNRFSIPAFTPALLNVSMILVGGGLAPFFDRPIFALAISVVVGGVAQLAFQLPYLAKIGMLTWPKINLKDAAVLRVIRQMGPAMFGVSVAQISLLLNTNFASLLQTGSLSWLYYADRLMELPSGVLGVALGTILLPSLAKLSGGEHKAEYSAMLDWGMRLCLILAVPATVALAVIGLPLIVTLFEHKAFLARDSVMTMHAVTAYAVGLVALIGIKVLAPAYYAQQDIRTPVRIGVLSLVVTQLCNLMLLHPMGHAGLALSISIGATTNAGLLLWGLMRREVYRPEAGWLAFLLKLALSVGMMALALWGLLQVLGDWHGVPIYWRVAKLALLVVTGAAVYFGMLGLLGFRPRDFARRAV